MIQSNFELNEFATFVAKSPAKTLAVGDRPSRPMNRPFRVDHQSVAFPGQCNSSIGGQSHDQATETPPLKSLSKAKKASITARLRPLRIFTVGVLPGPAPTMMARFPEF